MNKRRLKQVLFGSEVRLMGIIANGLVHKTPKAVIFRNMKKEVARTGRYLGLNQAEINQMWMESTQLYGKISKETFSSLRRNDRKFGKVDDYEQYLASRKDTVYDSVHKYFPQLEKSKNSLADTVEYRVKLDEKRGILGSGTVFFICNWFDDCAKDHVPYQGKVYVNDDWETLVPDDMHGKIASYIQKNHILTVNEVVNEAPWLTTRRNCRHRLFPISVEEALGSSFGEILKHHDLRAKHENEYNVVLTPEKVSYIGYYERLKALSYLNKLFSCKKLTLDIQNTRKLVSKWRDKAREG